MANMWIMVFFFGAYLAIVHSQAQTLLASTTTSQYISVFETGKFHVTEPFFKVKKSEFSNPEPLLIVSPIEPGKYPVLLFIHGMKISTEYYSQLFQHIASHGFIVVAPQIPQSIFSFDQTSEIEKAAAVAKWLPSKLQDVLNEHVGEGVQGDLNKVAISGHSRGGKTAFAVALGMSKTKLNNVRFSALIGVDPVAGSSKNDRTRPYVLTYEPNSFDLSIPVTVIGSGLGNHSVVCAANGVNHQEFYDECKESSHFVITEYGHMQMLDRISRWDYLTFLMAHVCQHRLSNPNYFMIKTLGGIMVAFLDNAYGIDDQGQYDDIVAGKICPPTQISIDNKKANRGFTPTYYAQA